MNHNTKYYLENKLSDVVAGMTIMEDTQDYKDLQHSLQMAENKLNDYKKNFKQTKEFSYDDLRTIEQCGIGYDQETNEVRKRVFTELGIEWGMWQLQETIKKALLNHPDATTFTQSISCGDGGGYADGYYPAFKGFSIEGEEFVDDGCGYYEHTFVFLTKSITELEFLKDKADEDEFDACWSNDDLQEEYTEWLENNLTRAKGNRVDVEVDYSSFNGKLYTHNYSDNTWNETDGNWGMLHPKDREVFIENNSPFPKGTKYTTDLTTHCFGFRKGGYNNKTTITYDRVA